jgi:hypothetical protein
MLVISAPRSTLLLLLLLPLLLGSGAAESASKFTWTKGGDTCAGILCTGETCTCDSARTCTLTAVGPCKTLADGATFHLESSLVGMAFVKDVATYATSPDVPTNNMQIIDMAASANNGYRDMSKEVIVGDAAFAYTMTGASLGSATDLTGGYVGITTALMTRGEIATKTTNVYVATGPTEARVARGDSTMGAPHGPASLCISEVDAGGACGAEKTFSEGESKFSIFGYTYQNFAGVDSAVTYLGVRMTLTLVGAEATVRTHSRSFRFF